MRLKAWLEKLRGKRPPVIRTEYGEVDEGARRQAAINMKLDPKRRQEVEELLAERLGPERAAAEMRRRYPEAYE